MWSTSFVIILFILNLTHVNTQDAELFNATTSKIEEHAKEDFFDTSTSISPMEKDSFNNSTSKTLLEDESFDNSSNKTLVEEDSFRNLTRKILVDNDSFNNATSETLVEEDSFRNLTNKILVDDDSFDNSTSKILVEEDSFKNSTRKTLEEEYSFDNLTNKTPVEEDSFRNLTSKILVNDDSFDNATSETLVEEDSFRNLTSKIFVDDDSFDNATSEPLVEKDYFRNLTNKILVDDDSFDNSTMKTLEEEYSFDNLTNKKPVEEDSFDNMINKTTLEENSFDTSTNRILVVEDWFDTSTNKTFVEDEPLKASTSEIPIDEGSFNTSTSKTLVEEDFFDASTIETPVEEDSFHTSTSETSIEEYSFYTSTSKTPIKEDYFHTSTSKTSVAEDPFDASTNVTPVEENYFDTPISKVPVEEDSFYVSTSEFPIAEDSFETTTSKPRIEQEAKMSTYILKVLEHYKQPDPQGFPGANMPDPLLVPDSSQFIAFGTNLDFKDITLHGVNKFHIVNVTTDIGKMECRAAFEMNKLQVRGKYSLNMWLNSYPGGFISDISGLQSEVLATLGVEQDGKLRAQNISIDITFKNITIQFENAGFLSSMLQGLFNSMGSILYDSIKSYLLEDAHTNMRDDINKKLDQIVGDIEFPNTISPIDMVLVDVRKKIKDMKMDPLCIEDYVSNIGMFIIALSNTRIEGLSTFHRVGNITITLENNTAVYDFNIGTKELQGLFNWEVSGMNGLLNKTGSFSFSIAYIQGRFVLAQPMDTRKRMEFKDLKLDVGNIQIRSDGTGTLDYIIELTANILPTLLRYQIISAIEIPIKWKIQQELDRINIEEAIINELPKIDKMQEDGFQLAELRMLNSTDEINFDNDEFFNF